MYQISALPLSYESIGGPDRTRTCNHLRAKEAHSQIVLQAHGRAKFLSLED